MGARVPQHREWQSGRVRWDERFCEAMSDPVGFFERVIASAGPAAKKLAMAKLRPVLEPHVKKQGLAWADVLPILDTVDTAKELQEARLGGAVRARSATVSASALV